MIGIRSKKYLTLKEAAKIFGYSSDYIGYLIRKRKIRGKKIYNNAFWKITKKSIVDYCQGRKRKVKNLDTRDRYISLKEASIISGYNFDYIGYLIRKGEVKGRKVSNQISWLVRREEIKKYKLLKDKELLNKDNKKKSLIFDISNLRSKTFNFSKRLTFATFIFVTLYLISGIAPLNFLQGAIGAIFIEEPKTVNFYSTLSTSNPSVVEGGWQRPENAQGLPEVESVGGINSFSESNSAVYKGGSLSLVLQNFVTLEQKTSAIEQVVKETITTTTDVTIVDVEEATTTEITSTETITPEATSTATTTINAITNEETTTTDTGSTTTEAITTGATSTEPMVIPTPTSTTTKEKQSTSSQSEIDEEITTIEFTTSTESTTTISESTISSFDKIKRFFGKSTVRAQQVQGFEKLNNPQFLSAKIKFSFAVGETEPDISIEIIDKAQETSGQQQATSTTTSSEEQIGFWNRVKYFFGSLLTKVASMARAEGNTTSSEILLETEPFIIDKTTTTEPVSTTTETITSETIITGITSTETISTTTVATNELPEMVSSTTETTSTEVTSTELILSDPITETNTAEIVTTETTTTEATTINTTTSEPTIETLPNIDTKIIIWWSLDGQNWQELDKISSYPSSNALNNGYFEYDASFLKDWQDIENLKIKFEGAIGGETNIIAFLDGVWVEVNYEELVIEKEQQKKIIESISEKNDFKSNEEPEFRFRYKNNQNILTSIGEFLDLIDPWENIKVTAQIKSKSGQIIDAPVDIIFENGKDFLIRVKNISKPGLYKIIIQIEDEGERVELEQDFYWGVLSINVNKSIYLPDEKSYVQMAVLDNFGHTICDANLVLEITDPRGNVSTPTIQKSSSCGPTTVTNIPDYYTYYDVNGSGIYQLNLTATTKDGTHSIVDQFEVRNKVPFDVERIGPTRIYPPATYEMRMRIKVNQDFRGEIIEKTPLGFRIDNIEYSVNGNPLNSDFYVLNSSEAQEIHWQVNLKKDDFIELHYTFDAPKISPYLYLLGPLIFEVGKEGKGGGEDLLGKVKATIGNFISSKEHLIFGEIRQWQIAADALSFKKGSFAKTSGVVPVSQSITDVGFEPKAVIFFWTRQTTAGFLAGQSMGYGFAASSTAERAVAIAEDDAASKSVTGRRKSESKSIILLSNGTPTLGAEAELTSFDSGGFTINWTTNEARADIIHYVAIGGADITNATTSTFNSAIATGTQAIGNLGFQPGFVMFLHGFTGSNDSNIANSQLGLGFATSSTARGAILVGSRDNQNANSTKISQQRTDSVILTAAGNLNGQDGIADFVSMDTGGFTINWSDAPVASVPIFYLALAGGNYQVGNFTQPAATGNQSIEDVGFQPDGVMLFSRNKAATITLDAPNTLSIGGAESSTSRGSIWAEADAVDPSDTNSFTTTTNVITMASSPSTIDAQADFVAFDSLGFDINWDVVNETTAREIIYWAIGGTSAPAVITVSGTIYTNEGGSAFNCSTNNLTVALRVNGAGTDSATCTVSGGTYSISNVTINAVDDVITVFLDDSVATSTVVTKASSTDGNIAGLDLYEDRVIIRHEATSGNGTTTIANMSVFDANDDVDVRFTATTTNGTATTTTILAGNKLYIWPNKTFNPGGTITVSGNAAASPDGDLHIANGATLTAGDNITVAGNWISSSTATFTSGSNTVTMNATTTGKKIFTPSSNTDFFDLTFNGSGGGWTFQDASATATNDFTITNG
ncbi:MAG: helix-turn-helix domain-containing protein, partial [Patescibacteria group bacterium]|nr:helix-turn-helix domain-containing protein [Patescibacteria group bacterium]